MAKINLVELAIKGVESAVLAKNIASMNPSLIIATRMINGIELPTIEQATKYVRKCSNAYKEAEIVKMEISNAFSENCLYIYFRYPRTVYWNAEYSQPENTKIVSYEEFREMDSRHNFRERQGDGYQYKMTYWADTYFDCIPENI